MTDNVPIFLFDLDGTLIDFSPVYSRRYANIIRETFAQFAITPDESFIKRIELFGDFEAIIKLIGKERADYFWYTVEQADFQLRKDLIQKGEIIIAHDAPKVLKTLQEILPPSRPLGLVSNTNPASAFWQMWHFNLMTYFQHIYLLNWNFTVPKPDPEGFLACLAEYGEVGEYRVVYVGDSTSDVDMIQRARKLFPDIEVRMILVDPHTSPVKQTWEADHVIASLSELPLLARKLISSNEFP